MNVFISADIEGISGVVHKEHTTRDGREHDRARHLMTEEVNAAIQGAVDAGATNIVVNDSHGTMRNLYPESLHPEAKLILGSTKELGMMQGIQKGFDVALFIGYHTKMGSDGILNHTYSSASIAFISINGIEMGEFGINALMASHFNTPVIYVSGCNHTVDEARTHVPNVYASEVKESVSRTTAENLHPQKAQELIRADVAEAIRHRSDVQPYTIEGESFDVAIEFLNTELADTAAILPYVHRASPSRIEYSTPDVIEGYRVIKSIMLMCRGVV